MVAFETLLLGIVTGIWPVRLMVAPPVATVELRLDAAAVGVMHGPPWAMACDVGTGPMPHELTAIGRDASGREVARATQWANLGRERARVGHDTCTALHRTCTAPPGVAPDATTGRNLP